MGICNPPQDSLLLCVIGVSFIALIMGREGEGSWYSQFHLKL